ncbi:MAG TPA: hypothetical protein VHO95_01100, partial [Candidatus Dormibacteraeota bacterium]|nr:hypothetical protein [Candidatus Dormibacteraeota bacterium]
MSEEEDLARRFLALWAEYLAALSADPATSDMLRLWLALAAAFGDGTRARSSAAAAAAAGASGELDAVMAELARRVDELDHRIAALERRRRPAPG